MIDYIKTYTKSAVVAVFVFLLSFGPYISLAQQTTIRPLPISTFTGLRDTPNSYTGDALDLVRVNAAGTALEFFTGSSSFASTLAEVSAFSNTTAKSLYQMTSGANPEFRTSDGSTLTYWDNANKRFGIGTSTLVRKASIVDTTDASLYIRRNTTTTGDYSEVLFQTSTSDLYATGIRSQRLATGFSDLLFLGQQTAGSTYATLYEIARFTAPGNFGLGTGATVSAKLHVNAPGTMSTVADTDGALRLGASSVTSAYLTAGLSTNGYPLLQGGRTSDSTAQALLLNPFGANVLIGHDGAGSARLHVRSTTEQARFDYDSGNYFRATVASTGSTTLDLVSSTLSFPELTINDRVRGSGGLFVRNSFFAIGGQGISDTSLTGFFDRDQLTDADLTGSITVNITGAGTNTPANNYLLVNGSADFTTLVSGVDATTSLVEIIVDTGSQQANYSAAVWQPYLMTRGIAQGTYANNIDVHVSSDGVNWYQGSGWSTSDFNTDAQVKDIGGTRGTLWMGSNSVVSGLTGAQWRYARFRLSSFVIDAGYPSNAFLWISQIGIRHYSAPMAKQYLNVRGPNTTYGNFVLGTGNLSLTSGVILPQSGSVSAPSYSFTAETNSGWYRSGAGVINLSVLGTAVLSASSSALTSTNVILAPSGTVSAPSFSFASETNSGWYRAAAGTIGLSIGGTQKISVTAAETRSDNNFLAGAAGSNLTVLSTTPRIQGVTTSGIAISSIGVADGTNNRRLGMYVNQTAGELGISYTRSAGAVPFYIKDVSTNRLLIDINGNVGINLGAATTADTNLHVLGTGFPVGLFERQVTNTNSGGSALGVRTTSTGDMVDGFGTGFTLQIEDTAGVANPIANFFASRNGADNTGKLAINVYNAGSVVEAITALNTGSIGMGASPHASAQLDVTSTTKGFLPPRMTATQASAITPVDGLMLYVTDTNGTFTAVGFWGYENGAWVKL